MKYAVTGDFVFGTVRERDRAQTRVASYVTGKTLWGDVAVRAALDDTNTLPSLYVEVRFDTAAEQQALYTDVLALKWTGTVSYHDCAHDETPARPCVPQGVVVR